MHTFDWIDFLTREGIPFALSGKNVKDGNVNIKCPWCLDDPSEHLGVNLTTGLFSCWRDNFHKGNAYALIRQLLGCTFNEAKSLYDSQNKEIINDDFNKLLNNEFFLEPAIENEDKNAFNLKKLNTFCNIKNDHKHSLFIKYLVDRKFDKKDIDNLVQRYGLMSCFTGRWYYRIIIPIYELNTLCNWTGRHIGNSELRYLSLSSRFSEKTSSENPVAPFNIKELLLNYDLISKGGDVLVICEGPFDSIKLDFYGHKHGLMSTCLFGLGISSRQLYLLKDLSYRFNKIVLLLDNNAEIQTLNMYSVLSENINNISCFNTYEGYKDPGEFSKKEVNKLINDVGN